MKKVVDCGLADFGLNKRVRAYIEIELREEDNTLSICGEIQGISYGQCIDEIKKAFGDTNSTVNILYYWWENYHLNDMHAGDKEQEKAVKEYRKKNPYDYDKICEYLDSKGLLVHNGYRYGTAWLKEEIPASTLKDIKAFIKG